MSKGSERILNGRVPSIRVVGRTTVSVAIVASLLGSSTSAQIQNTGLPLASNSYPVPSGSKWITLVAEQGTNDWNGDGDKLDTVVVAYDDATRVVTGVGFAVNALVVSYVSDQAYYGMALESAQGNSDLNGDGDANDLVPFRFESATGVSVVKPTFVSWHGVLDDDSKALATIRETPGNDLNGDGDTTDIVLHSWVPGPSMPQNLQLVVTKIYLIANGDVVVEAGENHNAVDWNADGDFTDLAVLYRAASASGWTFTGMLGPVAALGPSTLAILEVESSLGVDLNGDGDTSDRILSAWDTVTQSRVSSGLDGDSTQKVAVANERVAFVAREANSASTDLNGDGDALDRVLCAFDVATGVVTIVPEAKGPSTPIHFELVGDRLAYPASEPWLSALGPGADRNGDGDALDFVLTVRDLATGVVDSGRAYEVAARPTVYGDYVAYDAIESGDGVTDLNADGDTNDSVFVIDRFLGASRSSYVGAATPFSFTGAPNSFATAGGTGGAGRIVVYFDESVLGADQTGDGDAVDFVAREFDLEAGTQRNFPLASIYSTTAIDRLTLAVYESGEQTDLNGDGDTLDTVFHLARVPSGSFGVVTNYGTGCPTSAGRPAKLDLHGDVSPGGAIVLSASGGAPGSTVLLVVGVAPAVVPTGLGCPLLTAPLLPAVLGPFHLTPNGLEGSALTFFTTMPSTVTSGLGACTQAFFVDPVLGFVPSDGVQFTIGS